MSAPPGFSSSSESGDGEPLIYMNGSSSSSSSSKAPSIARRVVDSSIFKLVQFLVLVFILIMVAVIAGVAFKARDDLNKGLARLDSEVGNIKYAFSAEGIVEQAADLSQWALAAQHAKEKIDSFLAVETWDRSPHGDGKWGPYIVKECSCTHNGEACLPIRCETSGGGLFESCSFYEQDPWTGRYCAPWDDSCQCNIKLSSDCKCQEGPYDEYFQFLRESDIKDNVIPTLERINKVLEKVLEELPAPAKAAGEFTITDITSLPKILNSVLSIDLHKTVVAIEGAADKLSALDWQGIYDATFSRQVDPVKNPPPPGFFDDDDDAEGFLKDRYPDDWLQVYCRKTNEEAFPGCTKKIHSPTPPPPKNIPGRARREATSAQKATESFFKDFAPFLGAPYSAIPAVLQAVKGVCAAYLRK